MRCQDLSVVPRIAGARPRRQAANNASKRFKSYSSDEDSETSAETVPSEEEDSDDSNAGGKKKSKAAKARAVRSRLRSRSISRSLRPPSARQTRMAVCLTALWRVVLGCHEACCDGWHLACHDCHVR